MKVEWKSNLKIFTPQECQELVNEFFSLELSNESGMPEYYKNSSGFFNLPGSLVYKDRVTNAIRDKYPHATFHSTYARVYRRESTLKIHTDRKGLDLGMSICLEDKNNLDWPLNISAIKYDGEEWDLTKDSSHFKEKYVEAHCDVGYAAIMEGRRFPHWREDLLCGDNQRAVYLFYFWELPKPSQEMSRKDTLIKEIEDRLAELKKEVNKG